MINVAKHQSDRPESRSKCLNALLNPTIWWVSLVAGIVSGAVKWGTEAVMPARAPGTISPPMKMLWEFGVQTKDALYSYSGHIINYDVALVHILFSIVFAFVYCAGARVCPRITLGAGCLYGLIVTMAFHGLVLPAMHLAPPIWRLPAGEISSETLGHILWAFSIETTRLYLLAPRSLRQSIR